MCKKRERKEILGLHSKKKKREEKVRRGGEMDKCHTRLEGPTP
jgi:hypothetical protein